MSKLYPESEVEISGFVARHYGTLLNLVTFGRYRTFIREAVRDMKINPDDRILDLGSGPGYNVQFMLNYINSEGNVLGLDIGEENILSFREKFKGRDNVSIKKMRIDKPLPYKGTFDKALVSFVIHGLPHPSRKKLIDNSQKALKPDGVLYILDYGNFKLSELPLYLRVPFNLFECKYAFDYLERDWEVILEDHGFEVVARHYYFGNFTRLLIAKKRSERQKV